MYITNGRVFGGTPNILIFWLCLNKFEYILLNNWQGINNSHRTIRLRFNEEKLFFVPKLSIALTCSGLVLSFTLVYHRRVCIFIVITDPRDAWNCLEPVSMSMNRQLWWSSLFGALFGSFFTQRRKKAHLQFCIHVDIVWIYYTVRPNKKETRFISEISSLPRKI